MKLTIYGSGYVGLVTGACLSDVGNDVLCVDVNEDRVAALNHGEIPIHEAGLSSIITRNCEAGRCFEGMFFTLYPFAQSAFCSSSGAAGEML